VRLVEEDNLLEPLLQPALGDLRPHVLRLVLRLFLEDPQLALAVFLGHVLLGHVQGRRRRDVKRDLAREVLEVVVLGDEVGLAINLDEHADLAVGMDVARDDALAGDAFASLRGLCLTLDAQDLDRLVHVAVGLGERLLAVHRSRAGALAQRLDV